jgi:HEPN domain-containing protein
VSEEEFRHWQEISQLDEKAAVDLFALGNYPLSVFHCQQAVEKYLKALLYFSGKPQFSHSLTQLGAELAVRLQTALPEEVATAFNELDFHYTASRYPGVMSVKDLYTKAKAQQGLDWMNTCLHYLKALRLT